MAAAALAVALDKGRNAIATPVYTHLHPIPPQLAFAPPVADSSCIANTHAASICTFYVYVVDLRSILRS